MVEYEEKLSVYSDNKPHIPDVTYLQDAVQHHIDVAICQRYGKHRDMRRTAVVAKTSKYKRTWGTMFNNVHFVIFDNGGRPADGVCDYLKGLGIGAATLKTMQAVILRANETCYRRVLGRLAEETNRVQSAKATSILVSPDLMEDTIGN